MMLVALSLVALTSFAAGFVLGLRLMIRSVNALWDQILAERDTGSTLTLDAALAMQRGGVERWRTAGTKEIVNYRARLVSLWTMRPRCGCNDLAILAVLRDGASYSLAIQREITARFEAPDLGHRIYYRLRLMERCGLLDAYDDTDAQTTRERGRGGRPRRYYRLTPAGRRYLDIEDQRAAALAA